MDRSKYSDADGDFSLAPYFNFFDRKLKFDALWVASPHAHYGSASAFLPQ